MIDHAKEYYQSQIRTIRQTGLSKEERIITTPQGATDRHDGPKRTVEFMLE